MRSTLEALVRARQIERRLKQIDKLTEIGDQIDVTGAPMVTQGSLHALDTEFAQLTIELAGLANELLVEIDE